MKHIANSILIFINNGSWENWYINNVAQSQLDNLYIYIQVHTPHSSLFYCGLWLPYFHSFCWPTIWQKKMLIFCAPSLFEIRYKYFVKLIAMNQRKSQMMHFSRVWKEGDSYLLNINIFFLTLNMQLLKKLYEIIKQCFTVLCIVD